MAKNRKNSKPAANADTPKRGPGRPSAFPAGTDMTAFPTRVSSETLQQLRELAGMRANPFGLKHNSIGAELARIVSQAHAKVTKDAARRASKRTTKVANTEAAPVVETTENS